MKKASWIVEPDTRAGGDKWCYYCHSPVGAEHKADCVQRRRTVVTRWTIEIVTREVESWEPGTIEFHYNEGSWCGANFPNLLEEVMQEYDCLCDRINAEFVREATAEDEEKNGIYAEKLRQG